MDLFDFGGQAFRARLRRELPRWREQGWVDDRGYEAIAASQLGEESGLSPAAATIYTLGAMLVGGGVISLVAWNWNALGLVGRMALTGGGTLAAQALGTWFWFARTERRLLGHALLFLGVLLFGAAIFVTEQSFGLDLDWRLGLTAWTIAGAAAAWIYSSVPCAALTLVLALFANGAWREAHVPWLAITPYALSLFALPIAWRQNSRFLVAAAGVALAIVIAFALADEKAGGIFAGVFALAAALIAWPFWRGPRADAPREFLLRETASYVGFAVFGFFAFLATFHGIGRELSPVSAKKVDFLTYLAIVVPAWAFALVCCGRGWQSGAIARRPIASIACVGAAALSLTLLGPRNDWTVATVAHLALGATCLVAIGASVRRLARGPFWSAALTLGALVIARFLEYDWNLLTKALVFLGLGLALIFAGTAFERRLRRTDAEAGAR